MPLSRSQAYTGSRHTRIFPRAGGQAGRPFANLSASPHIEHGVEDGTLFTVDGDFCADINFLVGQRRDVLDANYEHKGLLTDGMSATVQAAVHLWNWGTTIDAWVATSSKGKNAHCARPNVFRWRIT